jgi:hypothetical protein
MAKHNQHAEVAAILRAAGADDSSEADEETSDSSEVD